MYDLDQNGAMIFVTDGTNSGTGKTSEVKYPGFYFYDSLTEKWQAAGGTPEPWYSQDTNKPATLNNENIFQLGQVGIGGSDINSAAQLDVSSNSKGVLLPRIAQKSLATDVDGLMYYDPDSGCFKYYSERSKKWLSLCGDQGMAEFNLLDCSDPTGGVVTDPDNTPILQGTNMSGNASATYTIKVNVNSPGSYTIKLATSNGYSFSKSGNFSETGTFIVVLEGQGTPVNHNETAAPDTSVDNFTSIQFNSIDVTPSCTLPGVHVKAAAAQITGVNCGAITYGPGEYLTNQKVFTSSEHYIDVPVTITGSGNLSLETSTESGLKFSSGSIAVTAATTTMRLFAQGGIGSVPGTLSFTLSTITPNCSGSITIEVGNSKGTFEDPANRCTEILDLDPTAENGYYWVQDSGKNKFKTYCDMKEGGWTLVKSLSEKQILVVERTQSESIATQKQRNPVTTKAGIFNEYAFSLSSAVVNNIGGVNNQYRFTIKEKGHQNTGTLTPEIVESTTVAPSDDVWAPNNYWNVAIASGGNPATGNYTVNTYTSEGKIFGYTLTKPSSTGNVHQFNGVNFTYAPPGFYSYANFFTGFYGALGYAGPNNAANNFTYTSSDGSTATFNKYYINDLFGLYMNSEVQLNHHIGTCANSTDDYGGAGYCSAGWNNWRPHGFNNGEGRIVQYWVK